MMGPRRKGRILAVQALFAYDFTHCGVDELIHFSWARENDEDEDEDGNDSRNTDENIRNFAVLLVAGTIENLETIDSEIKKHLEHWEMSRLNRLDLAVLRISVFSLLFTKDVPPSVVIDEAVDIAKDFGTDESYRFVNGVLDGIRKSLENQNESA
jgi:N utilization substance protein B